MRGSTTIGFEFYLQLAHYAGHREEGHRDRRLHGHSYLVSLVFTGAPADESGYVKDAAEAQDIAQKIKDEVDGRIMNTIPGMGHSMETLAKWVAARAMELGAVTLHAVEVRRESCGMFCRYVLEGREQSETSEREHRGERG